MAGKDNEVDPKFTDEKKKDLQKALINLSGAERYFNNWKKRMPEALKELDKLYKTFQQVCDGEKKLSDFESCSTVNIRVICNELPLAHKHIKDYKKTPL